VAVYGLMKSDKDIIDKVLRRLDRLEKAVFIPGAKKPKRSKNEKLTGPSGGVRFLVSKGFFRKKRDLKEVREELAKHEYHYRSQVIQTALNRASTRTGLLAASWENGRKHYVGRK
jgi:hypothetical protein